MLDIIRKPATQTQRLRLRAAAGLHRPTLGLSRGLQGGSAQTRYGGLHTQAALGSPRRRPSTLCAQQPQGGGSPGEVPEPYTLAGVRPASPSGGKPPTVGPNPRPRPSQFPKMRRRPSTSSCYSHKAMQELWDPGPGMGVSMGATGRTPGQPVRRKGRERLLYTPLPLLNRCKQYVTYSPK